jgi:thiol-disulfide isomerase/thioredoxin
MRLTLFLLFCLGLGYYFIKSDKPVPLSGISLTTKSGSALELCKNRKGCIGVYLAPWCGACQSSVSLINELQLAENIDSANFIVVVGSDQLQNLNRFASGIKGQVFIDSNAKFAEATQFSSVPRWFVINNQQELIDSFSLYRMKDGSPNEKLEFLKQTYAPFLLQ